MTTYDCGQKAETSAASFLEYKGCSILARNWRTRWCEIDIIASRGKVLYFCEVKYRRTLRQGSGLDYITASKLQKMRFAAEMWLSQNIWAGECRLCAIEVGGADFRVYGAVANIEL